MRLVLGVIAWQLSCAAGAFAQTPWQFTDVTEAAGFHYTHGYAPDTRIGSGEVEAAGVAAGDYDHDGYIDLYIVHGDAAPDLLMRNRGDGTFEDVAAAAGVAIPGQVNTGATFADVDGDGWLDLFTYGLVCKPKVPYCDVASGQRSPPRLFRNRGDGSFEDVTARTGITATSDAYSASFGDYDRDGDLDLFITHWLADGFRPLGSSEQLWRNDGNFAFTDVTEASGINPSYVYAEANGVQVLTFTANFADIDSDGWPDLLVAGDFKTSKIFHNNRDGTFTDVTSIVISDENGMGAAVGDYDNDGDLDWFVSSIWDPNQIAEGNWYLTGNRLYRNRGDGTFEDVTTATGVRQGYWGWGSTFADLNNDGWLDLIHVNGWRLDAPEAFEFHTDPTRVFIATGQATFTERSNELGLVDTGQGRGIVAFDYDRDGDIDIFIANNQQPPRLFRNDGGNAGNFLDVALHGRVPNSEGIGARVYVFIGPGTQMRELRAGNNFESQDPAEAHFGIGNAAHVDELGVVWPDGAVSARHDVAANQRIVVPQPNSADCSADASSTACRAGGGRGQRNECLLELMTVPAPASGRETASNRIVCTNGRPTCDSDRNAGDAACTLTLRLCINNQDPRLPYCVPSDVATFELWRPPAGIGASDDAMIDAINQAVGPGGLGLSIVREGTILTEGAPSAVLNHCSAPISVRVPLGRKTLRMFATSSDHRRDADSLTLECVPPM